MHHASQRIGRMSCLRTWRGFFLFFFFSSFFSFPFIFSVDCLNRSDKSEQLWRPYQRHRHVIVNITTLSPPPSSPSPPWHSHTHTHRHTHSERLWNPIERWLNDIVSQSGEPCSWRRLTRNNSENIKRLFWWGMKRRRGHCVKDEKLKQTAISLMKRPERTQHNTCKKEYIYIIPTTKSHAN